MDKKWYEKVITKDDFITRQGKDGNLYVRHNGWGNNIYIGPYSTDKDVNEVICSYIKASEIAPLHKHCNLKEISHVVIEDDNLFFND